jgi:hypothetical protein
MTSANRVRISLVPEITPGVTPLNPVMREVRYTSSSMGASVNYASSEEIVSDRMSGDPIPIMRGADGPINTELSFPRNLSPASEMYRSLFYSDWISTPVFDNDGVADSVVTDAGTVANTYSVIANGTSVLAGHMVSASGFSRPQNNKVFRVASTTATTIVGTALNLLAEAVPPGTACIKVVGYQGAAGDITTTATGLSSTVLNFTTLNLGVGQWVKIGGTDLIDRFNTTGVNVWVRVVAVEANALTLDHLPITWAVDAGAGKTVKLWFGDYIKNGLAARSMTIERSYLGQAVPSHIVTLGAQVDEMSLSIASQQVITSTVNFKGLNFSVSTVPLAATTRPVTTGQVMAANANVGSLFENGIKLSSPNNARELSFTIGNNLRSIEAIDSPAPVALNEGSFTVTGRIKTYFGNLDLVRKMYESTASSIATVVARDKQALVWQFPRVVFRGGGDPTVSGINTDVEVELEFEASRDVLTGSRAMLNRVPYFE